MMPGPSGSPDYSIGGLLSSALQIGTNIYASQLQKKALRQAARAGAADFPQLGMGLAATGPQRSGGTPGSTRVGIFDSAGAGIGYLSEGGGMDDSGMSSVGVVGRSRFPTQLIVYTTPSGQMKVGGYRSIGQPMLWSGDFAAVRRVARVARKLGRFVKHRRPR